MKRPLTCAILWLLSTACFSGFSDPAVPGREMRVRRGAFASEVILSGELEAARGDLLTVPALPNWQTAVKWLADDGSMVKVGEPVAELDNSPLTADLETKRQASTQALQELQQKEAEWSADLEEKQLDVEKKRYELERARIDAAIPADLQSARAWEEKQGALRKATTDFEKAVELLSARRVAIAADRRNLQLNIEKTGREIAIAEEAIRALVLRAPRGGIVVVRDHPWEGRKLQSGDPVWVGFPIAQLPELDSLRVVATLADVDDGRISVGMPATITLDGYPGEAFAGKISSISAVAQESRRASLRRHFEVIVALDRLDVARMRPGLSARVVVRRETIGGALLAPRGAMDLSSASPRARLASGGMKDVKIGSCNAVECVVLSGLEEGDRLAPVVEVRRG